VPQYTTIAGGEAMSEGAKSRDHLGVYSVQELHGRLKNKAKTSSDGLKPTI